jgi:pimeloyl-ACP methyl ester carboxylesterase
MSKKSQTIKDITQIVVFLLVVAILLTAFVIYPLNRTKAIMARQDLEKYNSDSLPANDAAVFTDAGLTADTFRIEADGLTSLACVRLIPDTLAAPGATPLGTAILLSDEHSDRKSMLPLAKTLVNAAGIAVITYDQRATGLSGGQYRSDGQREAADLLEVISYLEIRGRLVHPVTVVGRSIGAEAAILASREESRIDAVAAITPYLTTVRMIDQYRRDHDTYWLPFFRTIFWWWYDIRSSYAADMRTIDDIQGVTVSTLVLAPPEMLAEPDFVKLAELSDKAKLRTALLPASEDALNQEILRFVRPTLMPGDPKPIMK